jgi:hypothetical protein
VIEDRDPVAAVDAFVGGLVADVRPPAIRRRGAVLVTGPWLAGSSSVAAALRARLPDVEFVEADELRHGEAPVAVVFVVSATARLTESDCLVLDAAAAHTDVVVGVVSKIDVHRNWRSVLEQDRAVVRAHAARYHSVPWVGVAAAPDLGDPDCDELIDVLESNLADNCLTRRNRLRAWESRLDATIRQQESAVESAGREARMEALHGLRADALRDRRMVKSERTIALRSQVQQARVQLSYFAKNRCHSVRTELQEDAAEMTARKLPEFEPYLRRRVNAVIDEVDAGITEHMADVANELGLPPDSSTPPRPARPRIGQPPLKSRRLETRLMTLLGAGFGLGVALALSRLFADLAPGLTVAGAICCAVIGVAVTVWIVGTRGLLHDRAVLDRWISEVTTSLRATVDQMVATRVLAAEMSITSALSHQLEEHSVVAAERVKVIDVELNDHTVARARAAAARDRRVPAVRRALSAVRAELGEPEPARNGHSVRTEAVTATDHRSATIVARSDAQEG